MQINCLRNDILSMCLDDVIAVYVVRQTEAGTQVVLSLKEDGDLRDVRAAIKQIAIRAAEDAKDCDHARVG